jgi:hypothetical protein
MKRTCGNCGWGYVKFSKPGVGLVWCDWVDEVMLPKLKMKFEDLPKSIDKILTSGDEKTKCNCWTPRREGGKNEK